MNAFEITVDDVLNVVHNMGKKANTQKTQEIFDALDQFKVEHEALYGDSLEDQTKYAYTEIERQIRKGRLI